MLLKFVGKNMFVINRMLITGACYEYRLFYSKVHTFKKTNCSNNCDMYTKNFSFIVFFFVSPQYYILVLTCVPNER